MRLLLGLTLCFLILNTTAQQWLDEKYEYDSLMHEVYGTAMDYTGNLINLHMNIYNPICSDSTGQARKPLLIWIHGGGFAFGDLNDPSIIQNCRKFARMGYVTASIQYRLGYIADDSAQSCNFPNYPCLFATDLNELYRAYYRGVQDAKGALRYLINRNNLYGIDTNNVFLAGESAGSFIALGAGLMDMNSEKMSAAGPLAPVNKPNVDKDTCSFIDISSLPTIINRPDLGGIEGTIEPSSINYTIKGIGNIFGGMFNNLLENYPVGQTLPGIYSFHQPCDIIVPIDSNKVYWGLTWCFTNGYNCFGIKNTPIVYGSRRFSDWNTTYGYGYNIQNNFTSTNFPYNYLFGSGSCVDQTNNPCHAYDSKLNRINGMASFFATYVSTTPVCDTGFVSNLDEPILFAIDIYPNPAGDHFTISSKLNLNQYTLFNLQGKAVANGLIKSNSFNVYTQNLDSGIYTLVVRLENGIEIQEKVVLE